MILKVKWYHPCYSKSQAAKRGQGANRETCKSAEKHMHHTTCMVTPEEKQIDTHSKME